MSILIADSGSTKTNWQLADENFKPVRHFLTQGINPYYQNQSDIQSILNNELPELNVEKIFFYGSGCSGNEVKGVLRNALSETFNTSLIEVEHDLLGTCRSIFGRGKGIAAILGTGSNSCLCSNGEVIELIPSLGYVLGDEGSGVHIGKALVSAYFGKMMPEEISREFFSETGLTKDILLENVYQRPMPNRYLAEYALYVSERKEIPFFKNLLLDCFREFFKSKISRYTDFATLPLGFSGSIAEGFSEELKQVAKEFQSEGEFIIQKDPLPGLVEYHRTLELELP